MVDIQNPEFLRMNIPHYTGLNVTEDPKKDIEELQKVFEVMNVLDIE